MSSHKKILNDLEEIKERINNIKVTQEVKVENTLNVEDLRKNQSEYLSDIEWGIQEIGSRLNHLVFGLGEIKRQIQDMVPGMEIESGKDARRPSLAGPNSDFSDVNTTAAKNPVPVSSENKHGGQGAYSLPTPEELSAVVGNVSAKFEGLLFELAEIKRVIKQDRSQMKMPFRLTTGPIIRNDRVMNLYVKVLNNSAAVHKVRIAVFNVQQNPKVNVAEQLVSISPKCSEHEGFAIGPKGLNLQEFEVVLEFLNGDTQSISTLIAGTTDLGSNVVPENTFRHHDLLPLPVPSTSKQEI